MVRSSPRGSRACARGLGRGDDDELTSGKVADGGEEVDRGVGSTPSRAELARGGDEVDDGLPSRHNGGEDGHRWPRR